MYACMTMDDDSNYGIVQELFTTYIHMHARTHTCTPRMSCTHRVTNGRILAAACFSQGAPARAFTSSSKGSML